ncbi:MAG: tetratricopeptide repeat protein [Bacteroidetes bacterium]|nr:tetratricopeptide repeat protein [Bacteroidota bacterium]
MKLKLFFIALFFIFPVLVQANPDSLFTQGNSAYSAGKFKEARQFYESVISFGFESSELYLNLGNSCYRLKDYGWARVYFEKSKKLDPLNPDSESNLELVRSYSPDKITVLPQTAVKQAFLSGFSLFKTIPFILFLVVLTSVTLFVVFRSFENRFTGWKKYGYVTLLVFTLFIQSLVAAWVYLDSTTHTAIVVVSVADARSEPVESGATLFTLHMGTLVYIENEYKGWIFTRLENGNTGWIPEKLLGRVN